jgi:hypothetical protein
MLFLTAPDSSDFCLHSLVLLPHLLGLPLFLLQKGFQCAIGSEACPLAPVIYMAADAI